MNSSALATIKEISDGILFKSGIPEAKGALIDQLTRDGYRELNLNVLPDGRVINLFTMDTNLIIPFPDDLIEIKDIYVPRDNQIWSLTRRTLIPKITVLENGSEIIPEDWGGGDDIPDGYGTYFETKGGRNDLGYYEVDDARRRILFRNMSRSEVMLDYVSTGINKTEETYVPIDAKAALESYVMRELSAFEVIAVNRYTLHNKRYQEELAKLRMIQFNFTAFTDATYETICSSVQR